MAAQDIWRYKALSPLDGNGKPRRQFTKRLPKNRPLWQQLDRYPSGTSPTSPGPRAGAGVGAGA